MIATTSRPTGRIPATAASGGSRSPAGRLHLVVTGHVDHGKSTVIGRLLADAGSLPEGRMEAVRAACRRHGKSFEYAFLLDALADERAQGITIDVARVFLTTGKRQYVIIDAPGHVEFVRNMITGAAHAEAAMLVIDAGDGVRENSRRHAYLLSMLGVSQLAVLVNKMDLVGYSQRVFDGVVEEYRAFLGRVGLSPRWFIPISAAAGDNLVRPSRPLAWYRGPTVLESLATFEPRPPQTAAAFRMPVQAVYKFTKYGDERRIVAGTVESGRVSPGDEIVFYPSGKTARVRTIEAFNRPAPTEAAAGESAGFTLTEEVYVPRGELATRHGQPKPDVGSRIRVSLFWLGRSPLVPGREYVLRAATARASFRVERIHRVLDASDLTRVDDPPSVGRHEVAECTLALGRPLAVDTPDRCLATARFVILDELEIRGGGIVRQVLPGAAAAVATEPAVVWLTGLSGAGKSTIAAEVCRRLRAAGAKVEFLDGDEIRSLFPGTGFSREARDAHVKRLGFLASRLEHHGVFVVCALISPYAAARAQVRSMCRRFVEVHVSTPLAECERRDVKGLYERARRGQIPHFTGIDDAYEAPANPELRIDTTDLGVADAADLVMAEIHPHALRP